MGRKFDLTLDIKPRSLSGLLLAVHSTEAFFVLEMDNGEVKMTINTGSGDITTSYKPNDPYLLCDGKWHKITCKFLYLFSMNTFSIDSLLNKNNLTFSPNKKG